MDHPSLVAVIDLISVDTVLCQVITMIGKVQAASPTNIVEALDSILEVLRSSELYAPYFTQQVRQDKMTSDLVDGLMTVSGSLGMASVRSPSPVIWQTTNPLDT